MAAKKQGDGGVLQIAENRKARRDYELLERFEAGLSLLGSEVKSIRGGAVTLTESYIRLIGDELFLVGCHIKPYSFSRMDAHEPTRDRKLLLHRKEIDKITGKLVQQGLTAVPLRIYFKNGRCKLEMALAKGKKLYDKRQDMKAREAERAIERGMKRNLQG